MKGERHLQQAAVAKVALDDNVAHGCHDKFDLASICCTCEMGVDLLCLGQTKIHKPVEDIL